jgi:activator of HSP90 ATPase
MRLRTASTIVFLAWFVSFAAPAAAQSTMTSITLTVAPATGTEGVRISGTAPAGQPLEAALYARFSEDLPTVLLSRHRVSADSSGRYDAVLPIAPAYFRGAVVSVVVRSVPAGPLARASLVVGAPNVPAPPDELPPSVR